MKELEISQLGESEEKEYLVQSGMLAMIPFDSKQERRIDH
jgi:hypothetical protein